MAITIDYATKVISVPQSDLTLVSGTLYSMDTDRFRRDVMTILAAENHVWMPDAFRHNTEVTVAGTTYARTIEFINGYSIQFTPNSQWSVRLEGSNNNIFDVENGILVQNQVQVIPTNSAGLISAGTMEQLIQELWALQGLDADNPMTVTRTSRTAGTISQTISGDGLNTSTVTRN